MSTAFPVFGAGGRQEGDLTEGAAATDAAVSVSNLPTVAQRGPVFVLGEIRQIAIDNAFRVALLAVRPELVAALDEVERRKAVCDHYVQVVRERESSVGRDFRWPPKHLRSLDRHANRGWRSWVQTATPLP